MFPGRKPLLVAHPWTVSFSQIKLAFLPGIQPLPVSNTAAPALTSMAARMQAASLVFAIFGLLLQPCLSVQPASAPLLAWSPHSSIFSAGDAISRGFYQVASSHDFTSQIVLEALGKRVDFSSNSVLQPDLPSEHKAELVVVFLGSQVDAAVLRQAARLPGLQPLSGLLESAQSSIVLPFLQAQGSSIIDSLQEQLEGHDITVKIAGCFEGNKDVVEAARSLLASESNVQVLLVCPSTRPGSQDGLSAEIAQLTAIAAEVQGSNRNVVFVYAGNEQDSILSTRRRRLQAAANVTYEGFGQYQKCGDLCRAQVKWLEGILALMVLGLGAIAGMTCLYLLKTPTRFESMKEGGGPMQ